MSSNNLKIKEIAGDATEPNGSGIKFIIHCCNNKKVRWGAGFVLSLKNKWPESEHIHLRNNRGLGSVSFYYTQGGIIIANIIGQDNFGTQKKQYVDYNSLEIGMRRVLKLALTFRKKKLTVSIHCPKIGCGLAGGDWSVVKDIINRVFIKNNIDVIYYNYEKLIASNNIQ